jgi:flagellar basal-body rod modification protein FlgD
MQVQEYTYTPDGTAIPIVDSSQVGFNAVDSETFIKLLVTQLQNQDPTEPLSNEALLTQISQMRSLQSNIELSSALKDLTASQSSSNFASQAASLIGREVEGRDSEGGNISGVVDRAILKDDKVYLGIGDKELLISDVTEVKAAA